MSEIITEESRTVVDHLTLETVGEDIKCDGEMVWFKEHEVEVPKLRAAIDAINEGATSVVLGDVKLTNKFEKDGHRGQKVYFDYETGRRATATGSLTRLMDEAEEKCT